jgi:hypothetical protein
LCGRLRGRYGRAVRVIVIALAAATALAAAVAAEGAPSASADQRACTASQVTVLFWPQGHPPVLSLGFPEFKLPHVEVYAYKGNATFQPQNQLAYAGTDRKTYFGRACSVRKADQKTFQVLPARAIRVKAAVSCTLSAAAQIQVRNVAGAGVRQELYVIEPPNKLVVRAQIAPQGTNLSYSIRQCRQGPAPR